MDKHFNTIRTELNNQGVLQVVFDKPERLNILTEEKLTELQTVFRYAQSDAQTKALLITGSGKAFCAGADIHRLAEVDEKLGYEFARQGQEVFRTLETLGKPSLAAINGFAFGGGCELAMSATMRIASDSALFGQPEVKLGVIPGYGGTQRLSRLVGKGRALDLCITGRFINADTALQWGLLSEVTTAENLQARAEEILTGILGMGPVAVKHTIEAIDQGFDLPLDDALQLEAKHFAATCASKDKREGVQAFLEKRAANFTGE